MPDAAELREEARHFKTELLGRLPGAAAAATQLAPPAAFGGGILGIGYGAKEVGRGTLDGLAVRVYVRAKRPRSQLPASELIPPEVDGRATDVIAVGDLAARTRPVHCGVSIGHVEVTAGTLGCLVTRPGDDRPLLLSNNHVIAASNAAEVGDPILEPGPFDGGDPDDPIAHLTAFEPIAFDQQPNRIDAAIGELVDPGDVYPEIAEIGAPGTTPLDAALYTSVRKHGRTTGHTVGVVVDLAADIDVRFGRSTARFQDQLAVLGAGGPFSDGGDSGSLVVDAVGLAPVGLLFAGGGDTTFCNPIAEVLDAFDLAIVDRRPPGPTR